MRKAVLFLLVLSLFFKLKLAEVSPCPKYFLFEPDKWEEDRWYGLITLKSATNIKGVSLDLHFDKPVIQLGTRLGRVSANSKNTIFKIKNNDKELKADEPQQVEIFVVYDPYYDVPFPQLKQIILNGREICPKEQSEQINNSPAITININLSNCGTKAVKPTGLILNGQTTGEGEWPWHTALYEQKDDTKLYICGGTLISEKHILTAAHCTTVQGTTVPRDANSISVVLGKYGMFVYSKHEQNTPVSKIVVHPDFNRTNLYNDISIIITVNPFKLSDYVKPICLWEEDLEATTIVNRIGTVVGWGRDEKNNAVSDILMGAQMPVVSRLQCILAHGTYYSKFTSENTLCAGFRNGTSVCNGDSGGGLVFSKKGTTGVDTVWQIRGIVSNTIGKEGNVCDPDYYVIFTDVAKYLDWIKVNMK